jgi:hypothetical protein
VTLELLGELARLREALQAGSERVFERRPR